MYQNWKLILNCKKCFTVLLYQINSALERDFFQKHSNFTNPKLLNASICIEPFVSSWVFVGADSMQDRSLFTCLYWWKTELTCSFSSRFLQWKDVTEEKYVITPSIPDAAIIVTSPTEPSLKLSIHLTSPVVREQVEKESSGGMISLFHFWT